MKSYSAKAVANAFLDLAEKSGEQIQPMKLQKLVYMAHGWSLGIFDAPLVDEPVQAWKFGPVIASTYHSFKQFGSGAITKKAVNYTVNKDTLTIKEEIPEIDPNDERTRQLISIVWERYKKFTGPQLSDMTHLSGTPWHECFNGAHGVEIPNSAIKKHYKQLIAERSRS